MARESTIGSFFYLEKIPDTAVTPETISAITAGKTTSVTAASLSTAKAGDFVVLEGTGVHALDRASAHRISAVATGGVLTLDTDTEGATIPSSVVGTARILTLVETCFSEFSSEASKPGEIDVTTMCDLERRNVAGLSSPGTATFGGPLDLTDAGQQEILKAFRDGKIRNLIWRTRGGQTGILVGSVSAFSGGPQGVEQAVKFTGSFQISGSPIYLPPMA
jgi:hypothetical protein